MASLELRFYRYVAIILLGMLVGIAGWLAQATVTAATELAAIKPQLATLNGNLERLSDLPLKVQSIEFKQKLADERAKLRDERLAALEYKRDGS